MSVKHSIQYQQYSQISIATQYPQISSDIHRHACIQCNHIFKPRYLYCSHRYIHPYSYSKLLCILTPLQHTKTAINCSWKFNSINPFMCIGWCHSWTAVTLSLFWIESCRLSWHLFATIWWLSVWWSVYACKRSKGN